MYFRALFAFFYPARNTERIVAFVQQENQASSPPKKTHVPLTLFF